MLSWLSRRDCKIDILCALDSFRRQLERPRDDKSDWKSDCRPTRSATARPNSEFPGMEKLESQLGQAASRRLHKQPPLCKHCAVSARRRNCAVHHSGRLGGSFGAREATIFSKRGSPRGGAQKGSSFKALGIAHDVDEQDMGDLELDLFFTFGGHLETI